MQPHYIKNKAFTVIELLLVIAIIGLIASIIIIATSGTRAQARDAKRKAETDAIRKAIEMYYTEHGKYPIETEWTKLEEDTELQTTLVKYLPTTPKDPLYGKTKDTGEPFSYQYKSNPQGTEYKIHVEMETGIYASYEQASSGGWTEIVYTGGEGGPAAPTNLYTGYPSAQTGSENPTNFTYSTPFFSAINNHNATITTVQIQLTETTYATPIWDSGDITIATTNSGARTPDIFFGTGNSPTKLLEAGKTYSWRIRTKTADYSQWSSDGTIGMATAPLTARFYVGGGDGYVYKGASSWDAAHDATVGEGTSYWSLDPDEVAVASVKIGVAPNIFRVFLPIDTSKLPDTASVISAAFKGRVNEKFNLDNDGNDFVVIVQTSQASPLSLTVEDYDQCGVVNNPTEGSNRIDIGNILVGDYNSWALNATGTGWVSKTGWTLLGLREGHDVLDDSVADDNEVDIDSSESTNPPYLEATYHPLGPTGYALRFDGTDDYVRIPNSASLNPTTTVTVELWVKPASAASASDYRTVAGKEIQSVGDRGGYAIIVNTDQTGIGFYFTRDIGGGCAVPNLGGDEFYSVSPEVWHHIVGTYDRTQNLMLLYHNGSLAASLGPCTAAVGTTTKPFYIGADPENNSAGTAEFQGVIDKVRIYNRTLSASEMQAHYNGIFSDETGLIGLWHFDEGTGTSTADTSGNGNNGTLFNGPQWVTP